MSIQITNKNALKFVSQETIDSYLPSLEDAARKLTEKTGAGSENQTRCHARNWNRHRSRSSSSSTSCTLRKWRIAC